MKGKIKAYHILGILALVLAGVYLSLPEKNSIRKAPEYQKQVEETKNYSLYLREGEGYREESLALPKSLSQEELRREIILAVTETLGEKAKFQNLYVDGNKIFLSFKGKVSEQALASIRKSLQALGQTEEVRVLAHEK